MWQSWRNLSTTLLKMNNPRAEITHRRKRRTWATQNEDRVEGLQMGDSNMEEKATPRVIQKM